MAKDTRTHTHVWSVVRSTGVEKRDGFGEMICVESKGADDPCIERGRDESSQNVSFRMEDESEIERQGESVEMERDTAVEGNLMAMHNRH